MSTKHPPARRERRIQSAAIALAAAAVALSAGAATANAGTMRYWSCRTAGGTPTTSAGWSSSLGAWNYSNASQSCAGGGPLQLDATPQMNVPTNQAGMLWTYQAPANTTISNATLLWAGQQSGSDYGASVGMTVNRDTTAYDGDHVLDNCQWYAGCAGVPLGWHNYGVNADRVMVGIGCGGSDGVSCQPGDRAHVQIYSAGIDLVDNSGPQAGAISGSLLANRPLAGNESLIVPLTDVGVGVADVQVQINGTNAIARTPVDTNGGNCVPIEGGYRLPVPCKLAVTANLSVPTTVVPDGQYTVTATAWDAAGNATPFLSQKVTIDNVPPPAIKPSASPLATTPNPNAPQIQGDASIGALLTAFDGNWTDASAQLSRVWQVADSADGPWTNIPAAVGTTYRPSPLQAGKFLRITVTAVSKEGTTTASSIGRVVGQPSSGSLVLTSSTPSDNGTGGDPASGKLVPTKNRTKATVGFKKTLKISGKLVDAAGRPIVGGQIDVYETIAGGARTKVGTITTDAKGRYSWTPTTRSNRVEDLAYSRQKGSDNYQSTQSLQVFVRAGVHIRLKRSHIGPHGTGVVTGRVLVDGFPATGVRVEAFAIGTHKPQSGGTVKTDGTGRFRWKYQYVNVAHGTVALYFKVHRDPAMPALDAKSNIVRQRIG